MPAERTDPPPGPVSEALTALSDGRGVSECQTGWPSSRDRFGPGRTRTSAPPGKSMHGTPATDHRNKERTMSLSCPNCGSSPDPRDLFCGKCGHPVRVHAAQTAASTATSADGRAQWPGRGTSRISQAAPADEADQPAYPQRPVRDHRQANRDVPAPPWPSGGARSSWPFTERSAPMEHPQRNAAFPGRNAAFPGLPGGGTPRQSSGQRRRPSAGRILGTRMRRPPGGPVPGCRSWTAAGPPSRKPGMSGSRQPGAQQTSKRTCGNLRVN